MEVDGRNNSDFYKHPIQKFMNENNNLTPEECGYFNVMPFHQYYVFGKDERCAHAFIKFKKLDMIIKISKIVFVLMFTVIILCLLDFQVPTIYVITTIISFAMLSISFYYWAFRKCDKYIQTFNGNIRLIKK